MDTEFFWTIYNRSWILDLDIGFSILDTGLWILDIGYWILLDTGLVDTGFGFLLWDNAGYCLVVETCFWILCTVDPAKYCIIYNGYCILETEFWILDTFGYWILLEKRY